MAEGCAVDLEGAYRELGALVLDGGELQLRLVDCRLHGHRPPRGAIYIGREKPGLPESPLRSLYVGNSQATAFDKKWSLVVPDDRVCERFKRQFTRRVLERPDVFEALRQIPNGATLACWCVERDAARVGVGGNEVEQYCHGDVVFSVWRAIQLRGGELPWVRRGVDIVAGEWIPDGRELSPTEVLDKTWARLYELAFGEPMRWGQRGDE